MGKDTLGDVGKLLDARRFLCQCAKRNSATGLSSPADIAVQVRESR